MRSCIVGQNGSNVFVRESVKTVAANTRFGKPARDGEGSCCSGLRMMKCRVETSHLREVWMQTRQGLYRSEIMRLMKRR